MLVRLRGSAQRPPLGFARSFSAPSPARRRLFPNRRADRSPLPLPYALQRNLQLLLLSLPAQYSQSTVSPSRRWHLRRSRPSSSTVSSERQPSNRRRTRLRLWPEPFPSPPLLFRTRRPTCVHISLPLSSLYRIRTLSKHQSDQHRSPEYCYNLPPSSVPVSRDPAERVRARTTRIPSASLNRNVASSSQPARWVYGIPAGQTVQKAVVPLRRVPTPTLCTHRRLPSS
ncbi:hypothetical protein GY45DRAFT_970578 [Cubamyces sp. BRFM 1775]|nr:hypothetical protein GY45DRAFT_970578 [Cubamyces sp. BRFM 1775]